MASSHNKENKKENGLILSWLDLAIIYESCDGVPPIFEVDEYHYPRYLSSFSIHAH